MRTCYSCGSQSTFRDPKRGVLLWALNNDKDDNVLCRRCYMQYILNPKWAAYRRKKAPRYYGRTIQKFLGKTVTLSFDAYQYTKNVCSWCHRLGRMEMHHLKYLPCMPWACRIELCTRCHDKTKKITGRPKGILESTPRSRRISKNTF